MLNKTGVVIVFMCGCLIGLQIAALVGISPSYNARWWKPFVTLGLCALAVALTYRPTRTGD